MSRWSLLLFGGDITSPAVRRMAWRISVSSFFAGLAMGYFDVFEKTPDPQLGRLLAAGFCVYLAIVSHEMHHFYRHADEMLKRLLVTSFAAAGVFIVFAAATWGLLEVLVGLPRPSMLVVALAASLVSSIAWMVAAWRSS